MSTSLPVLVEAGRKRVFVQVLDWPGWCRSAKDVDSALSAVLDYRGRFAVAMARERLRVPASPVLHVVQTVPGNATTEFGAPDARAESDDEPLGGPELDRQLRCLRACWATLDLVAGSSPERLAKGPRGGGRDRDAIVEHVDSAESAYGRKIGVRASDATTDVRRELIVEALRAGGLPQGPRAKPWPLRYAIRRIAWHVLDHAWEIEDKSE